jgi:hypothetical protein
LGKTSCATKPRVCPSGPPFRCRRSVLGDKKRKKKKLSSLCSYLLSIIDGFFFGEGQEGRMGQEVIKMQRKGTTRRERRMQIRSDL